MGENSKIAWTDHTFNPWMGCTKVSPACKFCYAESYANHYHNLTWGDNSPRRKTGDATWAKPHTWNRKARLEKTRGKVFCASLADIFDTHPSILAQWREDLWQLIRWTPNLDWLLLTKRPENILDLLPANWGAGYDNVWLGITAENQKRYNERWNHLRLVPARVKFVSMEPLLGSIDMNDPDPRRPDWVIVGGESGNSKGIRPLNLEHVRHLQRQVKGTDTKFFFKQLGTHLARKYHTDLKGENFSAYPAELRDLCVQEFPRTAMELLDEFLKKSLEL